MYFVGVQIRSLENINAVPAATSAQLVKSPIDIRVFVDEEP